ncbi:ABC transporter permease/substrate-binding protein [Staphylococcus saccharolyticus]|uniref:ABC transporter permease/substrate-binding protein n=1 Tax=Staphylococcus saccharolyticus TaxID=33028 RepID=UPI00102DC472|nr:ABC transporter permease/substrate-binding protein [Staphylococcus saccharolyticus]MBL7572711.1 ABC transporter permease/substrate-binding protein [Staphylococcus saccharolyticus]MBL7584707.1 ABC transporter permease/substrate-binding protein [Staphylococcus saccharolyticus]MBL7638328.1 ABC transporter permease/substrate-binding protein [Staphylococcus saccharolyticus]QRJ68165.1 ABC transporter permease/substrate-binding protein [Staphylococcus saccharolyticus]
MHRFFNTLSDRKDQLLSTIIEHIQISFIALLIATIIAVPLAILLTKTKKLSEIVMNIAAVLQTIPSLALLGLMIPIFGIGRLPAIISLVVYALLPILRNTYTGIKEVDSSLVEAAKGIGMKPLRRLTKVELPIAMPVMMAGIRTAMVLIIGTATLAALIGAGGLGDLILLGIDRNDSSLVLIGAIPAALLAIIFDFILRYMERLSYKKLLLTLSAIVIVIVLAIVIPLLAHKGDKIMLAGKLGSEPSIITNMYKILIEDETDDTVEVKDGMGKTSFLFNALKSDNIDGYLEFTGTVLGELTKEDLKSKKESAMYQQAKSSLENKYNMTMLKPMKYNNTYALAVKRDFAKKNNIKTIGDLRKVEDKLKPGFTLEFNDRPDGFKTVKKAYHLNILNVKTMEPKLRYTAVKKGDINLIDAYSTDADLKQYNMVVLKDDKHVFPPYQGAPLFKEKYLKNHPEIKKPLNKLANKITDEQIQEMNYKVTVKKQDPYKVAMDYLKKENLIK